MDASKACARCQSQNDLKLCSRCKSTSYCSKKCQTVHRKAHKRSCEPASGSNAIRDIPRNLPSDSEAKYQDGRNSDDDLHMPGSFMLSESSAIQNVPLSLPSDSEEKYQDGRNPDDLRMPGSFILDEPSASPSPSTSSTQICGVKLNPGGGPSSRFMNPEARFVPEFFDPSHPIFYSGELCPLTALYSVPILLYCPTIAGDEDYKMRGGKRVLGDNQPAVYLRIELNDGFAPIRWQRHDPGPCYAIRQDRKPLSTELIETMYQFHSSLLSNSDYFEKAMEFGRPPYRLTPKIFKIFSNKYWKQQRQEGRTVLSAVDGSDGL